MNRNELNNQYTTKHAHWLQRRPSWYIKDILGNSRNKEEMHHQAMCRRVYGGLGNYSYFHKITGERFSEEEYRNLPE